MEAIVFEHALVQHHLSIVRDKATSAFAFRHSLTQLASLVSVRATADLPLAPTPVQTPITTANCRTLAGRIGLIPILRAGVIMVDPILNLIPQAEVWHLGLYRDEETAMPVPYYNKLPEGSPVDVALVLDPMLATGGSASMALQSMKDWGAKQTVMVSILSAPEGIKHIQDEFPNTQIYTCAIDEQLNEDKYIVPGLGDAGDRVFNTV